MRLNKIESFEMWNIPKNGMYFIEREENKFLLKNKFMIKMIHLYLGEIKENWILWNVDILMSSMYFMEREENEQRNIWSTKCDWKTNIIKKKT